MPKVLMIYGAWGARHERILVDTLLGYDAFGRHALHVVVMCSGDLALPSLSRVSLETRRFDHSLGKWFLWCHQDVLREKMQEDFDLLVFAEDDLRFTEDNLDYFLDHSIRLRGMECLPGFLRYERWDDGNRLPDMDIPSWQHGEGFVAGGHRYWRSGRNRMEPNPHQGCLVMGRQDLVKLASQGLLYVEKGLYLAGPQESATNWVWRLAFRKAWAVDDIGRMLVEHCDPYVGKPYGLPVEVLESITKRGD